MDFYREVEIGVLSGSIDALLDVERYLFVLGLFDGYYYFRGAVGKMNDWGIGHEARL